MSRGDGILVVAADPLLRKAVTETLARLPESGGVEAASPTRATAERVRAAQIIVLAAFETDLDDLGKATAAIAASGRPVVLVVPGTGDTGRAVAARLRLPTAICVVIPVLNIRDELLQAAPRLQAALKEARLQAVRPAEQAGNDPGPAGEPTARAAAPRSAPVSGPPYLGPVVCIGASTGGTDALHTILAAMRSDCAPIAIVQHMPEAYVGSFAARLDQGCAIDVELAADGVALRPGLAVVAPGGRQFRLRKDAQGIRTSLGETDRIGGHCPAVDAMMKSAAEALGRRAVGVLLTGMGRDGADGLLAMRRAGARTLAQDEATSTVYGMPKAAHEIGAADSVLPLGRIAGWIAGLTPTLRK